MSEAQAKAILDLRLHRLTGLERDKIGDELKEITDAIAEYPRHPRSREKLLDVLRTELREVKEKFNTPAAPNWSIPNSNGYRGTDPARRHGRHRHQRRLYQTRAAVDLPRPETRRKRAHGHGAEGRRFRLRYVRGLHPHAHRVLHVARYRAQDEGLAIAARHPRNRAGRRW
jgi:DNA gyrase/topoisomerase IV subunit A